MTEIGSRVLIESLKKDILSGKYGIGQPFPSRRALARRFGLAGTTVQRVLDKLVQSGLISQVQGRGSFVTKAGAARKIGLIMPGVVVSEFFRPIAATLIRLAKENDYTLIFGETYSSDPVERVHEARELVAEMIRSHVSGILYQPFEADRGGNQVNQRILSILDAKKIPVVLLDRDAVIPPDRTAHDLVAINNVDASERLTRHLVDAGAKYVCFLTNFKDVPNIAGRLRGFLCAKELLQGRGVRFDVIYGSANSTSLVRRKMQGRSRPDAIICDSDTTAAILRQTLDKLGYSVPRDLMIAGFDDVQLASLMVPPLTTIHQPCEEIGVQAFRRLLARIVAPDLVPAEILIDAPLVVRESTRRKKPMRIFKKRQKANKGEK